MRFTLLLKTLRSILWLYFLQTLQVLHGNGYLVHWTSICIVVGEVDLPIECILQWTQ